MAASIGRNRLVKVQWASACPWRYCLLVYPRRTYCFYTSLAKCSATNVNSFLKCQGLCMNKCDLVSADGGVARGVDQLSINTVHDLELITNILNIHPQRNIPQISSGKYRYNVVRFNSDDQKPPNKGLPPVMDFPEIVWPSLIKSVRNWVLANLIITPYFDHEFRLQEFVHGSKQAVEVVSNSLAKGDFDTLEGLVATEALQEIKKNVSKFSLSQRQALSVCKDDIYFTFPYQIGVMFNDDDANQKRFVEITMCYHMLQGLSELREKGVTLPLNVGLLPQYQEKLHNLNYRFVREFTKGVDDQWTINVVNHFRPIDYAS